MVMTFEELRELQRNEKKNKTIQQLPEEFWKLLAEYFKEKMRRYEELKKRETKLADKLLLQFERELINAVSVAEELYTLREKKIILLAWAEVSTGKEQDTMALTEEERELYSKLVELLSEYRKRIIDTAIYGKEVAESEEKPAEVEKEKPEEKGKKPVEEKKEEKRPEEAAEEKKKDTVTVKITAKVPAFLGRDLKIYGPFNPGEVVELPRRYAKLLVEKGKAEVVDF